MDSVTKLTLDIGSLETLCVGSVEDLKIDVQMRAGEHLNIAFCPMPPAHSSFDNMIFASFSAAEV